LAALLNRECRKPDVACRYGGEEFVLIMPNTGPQDAAVVAERVRSAIQATVWPRHPEAQVTVSIGVAGTLTTRPASKPEDWIQAAARGLYGARRPGRTRVVVPSLDAGDPVLPKAGCPPPHRPRPILTFRTGR